MEYGVIAAGIVLVVATAAATLGTKISTLFGPIGEALGVPPHRQPREAGVRIGTDTEPAILLRHPETARLIPKHGVNPLCGAYNPRRRTGRRAAPALSDR